MTSNNLISPMKFCDNTNFTIPEQSQRSRSVLQDRSKSLGLFWKEKKLCLYQNKVVGFVMLRLIFSLNRLRATPLMMMCMVARKRQLKWMFIESLKKVKNFCCCFFVKLRQSFERQFRVATVKEKHLEDVLFFFLPGQGRVREFRCWSGKFGRNLKIQEI